MPERGKSKKELILELDALREYVLRLEKEKKEQSLIWQEKEGLEHSLRERVKELNCLYGVARMIELYPSAKEKIFQGVVDLLPGSWQYPEITCGRIIFRKREYRTMDFKVSKWRQQAAIVVDGEVVGRVEVYYLKKRSTLDEGPFLKEERLLINAVSERLGNAVERINIARQLKQEKELLHNTNIALHEVLENIQTEKKMIGASIQANVDKIIFPIIYALETELSPEKRKYVNLLRQNLTNIVAPYADKVAARMNRLTPVETVISNMVKNGLTTKEIAGMRSISPDTVNRHRENIRRKLGLTNKGVNLVTFLNNVETD